MLTDPEKRFEHLIELSDLEIEAGLNPLFSLDSAKSAALGIESPVRHRRIRCRRRRRYRDAGRRRRVLRRQRRVRLRRRGQGRGRPLARAGARATLRPRRAVRLRRRSRRRWCPSWGRAASVAPDWPPPDRRSRGPPDPLARTSPPADATISAYHIRNRSTRFCCRKYSPNRLFARP